MDVSLAGTHGRIATIYIQLLACLDIVCDGAILSMGRSIAGHTVLFLSLMELLDVTKDYM